MKSINGISILFVVLALLYSFNVSSQLYLVSQLPDLLKIAATDSIQKIERAAALQFHKLLNSYRKKNKLDTIGWDEALWLTCRNHNNWMAANGTLAHEENIGTKNFIGKEPDDRYEFTTSKMGKANWSGENALYNYSKEGNTINEIAAKIALYSFEQWRHSPGHNSNMLGKNHKAHGVAFCLNDKNRVYGTDLFTSYFDTQFNDIKQNKIEPSVLASYSSTLTAKQPIEKRIKLDIVKAEQDLLSKLYEDYSLQSNISIKKSKSMERASKEHAKYMCNAKLVTHKELDSKKCFYGANEEMRLMKASHGMFVFKKKKTKLTENIAMIETNAKNLDIDKLAKEIQIKLDEESTNEMGNCKFGYGISIKRKNNELKIYVTRLVAQRV